MEDLKSKQGITCAKSVAELSYAKLKSVQQRLMQVTKVTVKLVFASVFPRLTEKN